MKTSMLLLCILLVLPSLLAAATVPSQVAYQGRVLVNGAPHDGPGQFKAAFVDTGTDTSQPASAGAVGVVNGFLTGIDVDDGGVGYVSPPRITISDPTGTGARAEADLSGGSVTRIRVLEAGSNYSGSPTVEIAPPAPNLVFVTYWSNDDTSVGGSEPASAFSLQVEAGVFSVLLGDSSLANMTPVPLDVFLNPDVHLRVWFNDGVQGFSQLEPDQAVTSVPYAMVAEQLAGGIPFLQLPVGEGAMEVAAGDHVHPPGDADTLDGLDSSGYASIIHSHDRFHWNVDGNEQTRDGVDFVGTRDAVPLEFRVNNGRVARFQNSTATPSIVLGHPENRIGDTVSGAVIAGGGFTSAVVPNDYNEVTSFFGAIGGGRKNRVTGFSATIPGGIDNVAGGTSSFACGQNVRISSDHSGVFMFGDSNSNNNQFRSEADNEFAVRCTGGARFVTSVTGAGTPAAGVTLASGASAWQTLSDRNSKENLDRVDGQAILEKVAALPLYTWNYKCQDDSIRHLGPTAQDFRAAFHLGNDEKRISTIDPDGVALAAIQGLHQQLADRDARVRGLEASVAALTRAVARLTESNSSGDLEKAGE